MAEFDEGGLRGRIAELISMLGDRQKAAATAEMSVDQLAKWRAGDARPPFIPLARMCEAAGMSLDWLAFGSPFGEMYRQGPRPPRDDGSVVEIPVLNVRIAAGSGAWNERAEEIERAPFQRDFFRRRGIDHRAVHGIRPNGDSMLPTIAPQALCLVNTAQRDLVGDGIWAFVLDDQARIKRVQRGFDGSLTLLSDNGTRYPPERVERDELHSLDVVGKLFWSEQDL